MGKEKQKPSWHRQFLDGFCQIPNDVMASEAVRSLQPSHFMVMMMMVMHLGRAGGSKKNGKLAFPNRAECPWWDGNEGKWTSLPIRYFTRSTTGAALRELEERGLIECTKRFTYEQKRHAKEYRLTWVRTEEGEATNNFRAYKHPEPKRRPTLRPKRQAIGQPVGKPEHQHPQEPKLQASQQAYSEPHRPASRPHYYQIIGEVSEGAPEPDKPTAGLSDAAITSAMSDIRTAIQAEIAPRNRSKQIFGAARTR